MQLTLLHLKDTCKSRHPLNSQFQKQLRLTLAHRLDVAILRYF